MVGGFFPLAWEKYNGVLCYSVAYNRKHGHVDLPDQRGKGISMLDCRDIFVNNRVYPDGATNTRKIFKRKSFTESLVSWSPTVYFRIQQNNNTFPLVAYSLQFQENWCVGLCYTDLIVAPMN